MALDDPYGGGANPSTSSANPYSMFGGQNPWGMPQGGYGYGGYGGSPMFGGMGGYGNSMWGGMQPQGQAPAGGVDPNLFGGDDADKNVTQTNTVTPWNPQGNALADLYRQNQSVYYGMQNWGPTGFDPSSTNALARMQNLSTGANPLVNQAVGAVGDISSGRSNIGTDMFDRLYQNPMHANQYQDIYNQAQQPGGLNSGIFGNIARGGQLSVYPQYQAPGQGGQVYPGGGNGGGPLQGGSGQGVMEPGGIPSAGQNDGGISASSGYDPNQDPRTRGIPDPRSDPNPYRSAALDDALSRTRDQIAASMSSAGRYGSSAMGDAMSRGLGGVAANFNLNAYNSDQDRMIQAAGMADQSQLARMGLGLQAAQGATGVEQANRQTNLAAAQGVAGIQGQNIAQQLQAAGMAGQANDLRYSDPQREAQVGAAREQMDQQQQDWYWKQLAQYGGNIGSIPGSAGTQQTSQPDQPWWQTLLGGAGAIGGLAGMFGGLFG